MPAQVVVESLTGLRQSVQARRHQWVLDEPQEAGGDDAGPDPYDQLLAALGACAAITLRLYARRHAWRLDHVRVELSHERIHARDCETCETLTGKVDRIQKAIFVEGALNDEQLHRLLESAKRCPVNQTLATENEIVETITREERPRGA